MKFEFFRGENLSSKALAPEGIFTVEESDSLTPEAKVSKILELTSEDISSLNRSQIISCLTLLRTGIGSLQSTTDSSPAKSYMLAEMKIKEIDLVMAVDNLEPDTSVESARPVEEKGPWSDPALRGGDGRAANRGL